MSQTNKPREERAGPGTKRGALISWAVIMAVISAIALGSDAGLYPYTNTLHIGLVTFGLGATTTMVKIIAPNWNKAKPRPDRPVESFRSFGWGRWVRRSIDRQRQQPGR